MAVFATVIVILFWANLIAAIFLFSAELCARLNEWIIREDTRQAASSQSVSIAIRDGRIQVHLPDKPGELGQESKIPK